ncbi:hypothetical protein Q669_27545 [Labrenzia sp. C1B10]|nr:hypothetical protein Q669_27545 [Labrenzia sp. C1B10]ERP99019.1 hypothetical protein Q675_15125 [Labrenzia sp. C1B70]
MRLDEGCLAADPLDLIGNRRAFLRRAGASVFTQVVPNDQRCSALAPQNWPLIVGLQGNKISLVPRRQGQS